MAVNPVNSRYKWRLIVGNLLHVWDGWNRVFLLHFQQHLYRLRGQLPLCIQLIPS